ncbi:MAG: protein-L-isoaspartate O-methyltransferase, partial [Patescibacteria group bacterium]|nr:protein-L-isoaspartate O-methyltransferase [Patescibacteria group bacterium]
MAILNNESLVDNLIKAGYLKTASIIDAFKTIDRAQFVKEEDQKHAYVNYPLAIGFGQTISQPLTVAFMLELLSPKLGEKILDIGAGSGWQTALLAQIVGDPLHQQAEGGDRVIAIERISELKTFAEKNISKYGFIEKGIVKIIEGDGSRGYEEEAPFDKIIAAAAGKNIPEFWKKQLKIGGLIVAPVNQSI